MAKIKNTMTVSLEEFGKKAGEYALDEYEYNGLTIRQWADKITSGEYQPVQHGRWINGKNKSAFPAKLPAIWYCSCCGEMIRYNDSTGTYQKKKKKVNEVNPRCRRCGAKMDGGEEDATNR